MYNWQHKNWAEFVYNEQVVSEYALQFAELSGVAMGVFNTLDSAKQQDEIIGLIISEALKTSAIEGEMLSREDLMSSIRNRLGLNETLIHVKDKRAENVALLMLKVRENYADKLSEQTIKEWHQALFSNSKYVNAGEYRKGVEPMQIVSGAFGREVVHYEAPPSDSVPVEMKRFVNWYNSFETGSNLLKIMVKTAITHLYFESIHPFEDGNGRIGRALIEKCLAESLNRSVILSVSTAIENDRKRYYAELNRASMSLEIDDWLVYFAKLLIEAQRNAIDVINLSIKKARLFDTYANVLNERQIKVLNKMFDLGAEDFEGGMTTRKYASIARTTKATATRDLQEMTKLNILMQKGDGRSTHYVLNL